MSKLKVLWQKIMHWLLGEEGEIQLNVAEIQSGLQLQREACTRLMALAMQAKREITVGMQKKTTLHAEALLLVQQGQDDLALAKADEEANIDQEIISASERFEKLHAEADMQWQLYQQRAGEVKKRLQQARHLMAQAEVNRLRERAQLILDSSSLSSAMSRFDEAAQGIELASIMNDARAAVEAELSGHERNLHAADLILEQARRQERLAALKREALPVSTSSEPESAQETSSPEPVKVEKTI